MFLQFPDTLPGLPAVTKLENDDSKNNISNPLTNDTNYYTTYNIPEGQLGKLLKMKSGKMKLVLGENYTFNILQGIQQTYLQVNLLIFFIKIP